METLYSVTEYTVNEKQKWNVTLFRELYKAKEYLMELYKKALAKNENIPPSVKEQMIRQKESSQDKGFALYDAEENAIRYGLLEKQEMTVLNNRKKEMAYALVLTHKSDPSVLPVLSLFEDPDRPKALFRDINKRTEGKYEMTVACCRIQ